MALFTEAMRVQRCDELRDSHLIEEMNGKELRRLIFHLLTSIQQDCEMRVSQQILDDTAVEIDEEYGWLDE